MDEETEETLVKSPRLSDYGHWLKNAIPTQSYGERMEGKLLTKSQKGVA